MWQAPRLRSLMAFTRLGGLAGVRRQGSRWAACSYWLKRSACHLVAAAQPANCYRRNGMASLNWSLWCDPVRA